MRNTETSLSPMGALALLNSKKAERKSFCLQIIESLENGTADPLQVHIYLKNLEAIFKTFTDEKTGKDFAERYKTALLAAAQKYGSKEFDLYNAKFQVKEAGVKYDWASCKDPIINDLLDQQILIDAKVKARQDLLKTISEGGMVVTDEASGETSKIYRPAKTSTTTVAVTLS